jgi:squalene cyclase
MRSFGEGYHAPHHTNFGAHNEVTGNALHFFIEVGGIDTEQQTALRRALLKRQHPDGYWEGYWYPSPWLATCRAVRALGGTGEAVERVLAHAQRTQQANGGWGDPETTPYDTAYALLTGRWALTRPTSWIQRGIHHLLATQQSDGRWPGTIYFYYYYPKQPGKTAPEAWHDRKRGIIATSMAVSALAAWWP